VSEQVWYGSLYHIYTEWLMSYGHNCRRWFLSLWDQNSSYQHGSYSQGLWCWWCFFNFHKCTVVNHTHMVVNKHCFYHRMPGHTN
jgi:hypothetical protein